MRKYKTGFCSAGFCEGTKPKSPSGKPIRICDILECPCECHANITAMFEMIGKERPEPHQNPEYIAMIQDSHERTAAMLEGVRRATVMGRDDVMLDPSGNDAPDEIKITAVNKPQTFTPTGRRTRGSLEHEVLLVCERFANQEWEEFILCTPKFVAEEIGRIHTSEPPSTGAVSAVWARWEKLGFAEVKSKPARFYAFKNPKPELGHALELERVKDAAKRVKRRTAASTQRGDGLLARAKEKKAANARKTR